MRSTASSEFAPSEAPSQAASAGVSVGEGESVSGSSGFVHASRVAEGREEGGEGGQGKMGVRTQGKSKVQLWNDVKIYCSSPALSPTCSATRLANSRLAALTRAFTLIYVVSLLTLLTRIQLNLLGRRNYLSSVVSLAAPASASSKISLENHDDDGAFSQDYGSDFDTNRMYLTFSWWLLHRGWNKMRERVEATVREVFGQVNPRDNVAFERFAELVLEVRKRVEGADDEERRSTRWLGFLLPEREGEEAVLVESGIAPGSPTEDGEQQHRITPSLRRLLDETSDIVDSPTFSHVLTLTLDAQFSLLVDDKIAVQAYKIPGAAGRATVTDNLSQSDPSLSLISGPRVEEIEDDSIGPLASAAEKANATTCKLATTLAVVTRQAHVIGSGGDLNTLMTPQSNFDMPGVAPTAGSSLKDANEYVAAVDAVRDLEAFAAVVYSSNFELEGVDDRDEGGAAGEKTAPSTTDLEKSLVDVGKDVEGSLESAWGKAVASARAES